MSIKSFKELDLQCQARVGEDNGKFGINSIYLPNPVLFTQSPTYCFIGMEPSLSGNTPEAFQGLVNRGFQNFLCSEGDFTLHYCAFHFLCFGSFDYHITDISKGAMNTGIANDFRKERWADWLTILQQELMFLNASRLIAIGSVSKKFMETNGFSLACSITHYSQNNSGYFSRCYENLQESLPANLHRTLKEFADNLLDSLNYPKALKAEILSNIFNKELTPWKQGRFLNYRDTFSVIANSNAAK